MRLMGYRKIFIAWLLLLAVFVNTAMAEVCLCGNLCSRGLCPNSDVKVSLFFHLQCTSSECKGCQSVKSEKLKAVKSSKHTLFIKLTKKLFAFDSERGNLPSLQSFGNMDLRYDPIAIPPSPIYLINLSLLL